jgi:hypothetical protein
MNVRRRGFDVHSAGRQLEGVLAFRLAIGMQVVKARAENLTASPGPPRSYPGAPPKKESGLLNTSHHATVELRGSRIVGRVWNDAPYAAEMELGGPHVLSRPWLRLALYIEAPAVMRILETGR